MAHIHHLVTPDTLLLFDEYWNFTIDESWREHEFKAFAEYIAQHDLGFRYVARSSRCQVAIKVFPR